MCFGRLNFRRVCLRSLNPLYYITYCYLSEYYLAEEEAKELWIESGTVLGNLFDAEQSV